ncbi:unnamed protein product [Plutella xylostella]|uniref:(diamondback moth) hypothetical protein n=1 Tax=Plutella xylostella TaxID=51655 RepID=A0A8S4G5P6_PLUXY|nr:unnamed protein product [Plutella xylostella]
MFSKFVIFAILILIPAWIVYKYNNTKPPELPEVNLEEWWGPGERKPDDTSVRSFRIEWSKEMISDLRRRLTNHRPLTPPLEGIAHQYGFNTATLQPILDFWRDEYDFEARLEYLNKFPQYKTKIQGLDIHFLWVKPKAFRLGILTLKMFNLCCNIFKILAIIFVYSDPAVLHRRFSSDYVDGQIDVQESGQWKKTW